MNVNRNLKIAPAEEIAWRQGWIGDERLARFVAALGKSSSRDDPRGLLGTRVF